MTKEQALNILVKDCDTNQISDGYHTFGELYEHRIVLWISRCRGIRVSGHHKLRDEVWISTKHSDGGVWDGWFMLGIGFNPGDQMTYHLPMNYWDECDFAQVLEQAPPYDGHTSADVLKRIALL